MCLHLEQVRGHLPDSASVTSALLPVFGSTLRAGDSAKLAASISFTTHTGQTLDLCGVLGRLRANRPVRASPHLLHTC